MIHFNSISLRNIIYYEQAQLDLAYVGTTVIMGLNKNSNDKERRNGSGKNLLLSPLPHLKYSHPSAKHPRTEKHSLFVRDNSSIEWNFNIEVDSYAISKSRGTSKTIKWQISKNGVNQNPRTAAIAEDIINKLIPLSEEEFYSTVYLDSRRPSPILHGTVVQRQEYLSTVFNLGDYSTIREYFREELKRLANTNIELEIHKQDLKELNSIKAVDADDLNSQLESIRNKRKAVSKKLERINADMLARSSVCSVTWRSATA